MKRESAAERALKGQIKRMQHDETLLTGQIELLAAQRETLMSQRRTIETEVYRLQQQRVTAAEARRP